MFFGINVHFGSTSSAYGNLTPAQYVALFRKMGIRTVRTNIASAAKAATVRPYLLACTAAGIDVVVVIDQGLSLTATFAANKTAGATLGKSVANALVGTGVKRVECSNEFDFNCKFTNTTTATRNPRGFIADGSSMDDFVESKFEAWRGWVAGMVPAVKGYGFSASYASGVAFPQTAYKMLRDGLDVRGAKTKEPIAIDRWVGAHFYDNQGDPTKFISQSRPGGAPTTNYSNVNTLAELKALGIETFVTEWGSNKLPDPQATHIASRLAQYWGWKDEYGVKRAITYCLFADAADSGTGTVFGVAETSYGLILADGVTPKPAYASFVNFSTLHA
jgi:hypothetical protein